ncbi:hypothetical protein DFO70_1118 [Cytobacillus firmus]|uniref:Uncharacterized protein n=2 Tax=Cytobacillus TaxID=2675230 RepID=A0A366JN66_CYTFI|nr:hypothetical protein DFO70_1118 [Cytobacillus firmus]TDX47412.1 hypothetical protein DFO72_101509 [Cytobacillus oceanisediminis]
MVIIWSVHKRLAELRQKQRTRELNSQEEMELQQCLDANMFRCLQIARLQNESFVAHLSNDHDWQHDVCRKLDEIFESMKI